MTHARAGADVHVLEEAQLQDYESMIEFHSVEPVKAPYAKGHTQLRCTDPTACGYRSCDAQPNPTAKGAIISSTTRFVLSETLDKR